MLTENCWFWTGNTIVPCRWEASYHVWNTQLYFSRGNMKMLWTLLIQN